MEYEIAKIEKTDVSCKLCEAYIQKHSTSPPKIAVMACEGACAKGEIARQAANIVAHRLAKDSTVRICLGGAFTKEAGPRYLIQRAERTIAIEGCPIACSSRMMKGVLPGFQPEIILADTLHKASLPFGLEEADESQLRECARVVAEAVVKDYINKRPAPAARHSTGKQSCCE